MFCIAVCYYKSLTLYKSAPPAGGEPNAFAYILVEMSVMSFLKVGWLGFSPTICLNRVRPQYLSYLLVVQGSEEGSFYKYE